MKKLWKYLSTIGLTLVACLCLGVGLKASERAQAAKDYDVYVANGSSYTMSGGTMNNGVKVDGTFTMNGGTIQNSGGDGVSVDGTFIMNNGTIQNCKTGVSINYDYLSASKRSATIYSGTIQNCDDAIYIDERAELFIRGGNISAKSNIFTFRQGSVFIYGGTISGGVIDLISYSGHIDYYGGTIKSTIKISYDYSSSVFTLYKEPANVLNIELNDNSVGSKVVDLKEISTIDLSKLNVTNLPSGCKLEIQTINGEKWVVVAKEATTTNYTVTISAGTGGRVSQTSVTVPSGTTYTTSGSTLRFSNGTTVTATANSGYTFDHWSSTGGTVISSMSIWAYFSYAQADHVANVYFDLNYAYIPAELPDEQTEIYNYMDQYKYTFNESEVGQDFNLGVGSYLDGMYDELEEYGFFGSYGMYDDEAYFCFAFYGEYAIPVVRYAYFFQELLGTKLLDIDNFGLRYEVYESDNGSRLDFTVVRNFSEGVGLNLFQWETDVDIYVELIVNEQAYNIDDSHYVEYKNYLNGNLGSNPEYPEEDASNHNIKILKDDCYTLDDDEIRMLVGYEYALHGGYDPLYDLINMSMDEILEQYDEYVNSGQIQIDDSGIDYYEYCEYWGVLDSMYPDHEYFEVEIDGRLEDCLRTFYYGGYDLYFSEYFYYFTSLTSDTTSGVFQLPEHLSSMFESILGNYYDSYNTPEVFNSIIRVGTLGNYKTLTEKYWDTYINDVDPNPDLIDKERYEKYYTRGSEADYLGDTRILENRSELFVQSTLDLTDEMKKAKQYATGASWNDHNWWGEFLNSVQEKGIQTIYIDIISFIQTFCAYALESYEITDDKTEITLHFNYHVNATHGLMDSLASDYGFVILGYNDDIYGDMATWIDDYTLKICDEHALPYENWFFEAFMHNRDGVSEFLFDQTCMLMSTNLKWLSDTAATFAEYEVRTIYTYMFNLVGIPTLGSDAEDYWYVCDRYESLYKFNFVLINNLKFIDIRQNNDSVPLASYILQAQLASQNYANVFEEKYKYFDIFYSSLNSRTVQYAKFIQ